MNEHFVGLPEEIRGLFSDLWIEVTMAHGKWYLFKGLFMVSKEKIDLLNESAGGFFSRIYGALFSDVTLAIGRLTDSANTSGQTNASLKRLFEKLEELDKKELVPERTVSKLDFEELWLDIEGLWQDLIENGYINNEGHIQEKFKQLSSASDMRLQQKYVRKIGEIWSILQQHLGLKDYISSIDKANENFKTYRNRWIAHRDIKIVLSQMALPPITVEKVEAVLETIRRFMNRIQVSFLGGNTRYEALDIEPELEQLYLILKQAAFYREQEKEGLETNPGYKPELKSETRWNASKPIADWKPEVME
jgi:hypothetical protein